VRCFASLLASTAPGGIVRVVWPASCATGAKETLFWTNEGVFELLWTRRVDRESPRPIILPFALILLISRFDDDCPLQLYCGQYNCSQPVQSSVRK
jgi:hypothetical protein